MGAYRRVMVDLETLGVRPGCVILSVGAVFFSSSEEQWKGPAFYSAINRLSCLEAGLVEDPDTVAWWRGQGASAREVLAQADLGTTPPLPQVLEALTRWVRESVAGSDSDSVQLWGNGATFDNTILDAAYAAVGLPRPWGPYSDRCYRTLKGLYPGEKLIRTGVHHNALDDAVSQAEHAVRILKKLRA